MSNVELDAIIDWCRRKLKYEKYQHSGLSGRRAEGYELAMKSVMSYLHSLKETDNGQTN